MPSKPAAIRLTPAERAAVEEAMRRRRMRTGDRVRLADLIREGLTVACAAEGVAWPAPARSTP